MQKKLIIIGLCIFGILFVFRNSFAGDKPAPPCVSKSKPGEIQVYCKDSLETVIDVSKLLISISTGIFVIVPAIFGMARKRELKYIWVIITGFILLALSIFSGVCTILSLATSQRWGTYDIFKTLTAGLSLVQLFSFATGAILVGGFFLWNALFNKQGRKYVDELRIAIAMAEVYKQKKDYDEALRILNDISP